MNRAPKCENCGSLRWVIRYTAIGYREVTPRGKMKKLEIDDVETNEIVCADCEEEYPGSFSEFYRAIGVIRGQ